jgi:hypothetical protein
VGQFTVKNYQIAKAPKLIRLLGDKRKPESAQHIIEFPGGAIELSRTSEGHYWAHIIINRSGEALPDLQGLRSAHGTVLHSRFASDSGIEAFPPREGIYQIAVLIGFTLEG